jgi:tRNA 2-selenouridine synthase
MARHKGSLLGALPDHPQPSQTAFETALAAGVEGLDFSRPLYIEGEGPRIGQLNLPVPLVARMRAAPCVEIQAALPARLDFLLRDYAYLGERPQWLADQLAHLKPLHGKDTITAWQAMAHAGNLPQLFAELATRHYDPAYARSQRKHFYAWDARTVITADDLSPEGIVALAREIAAREAAKRAKQGG